MLEDLAIRYASQPARLDPARRWAQGVFS